MTEKEKMLLGMLYDANYDNELVSERTRSKDICHAFNQLLPSSNERQKELMESLLGCIKGNFTIIAPFWCDYGYNIEIGDNFYANHNCVFLDTAKIMFGDNVFIAPNCCFSTAGHPLDSEQRSQGLEFARPITVGSNVWFGVGVNALPGVTIGNNTVIGAGSIVTKDIPEGVVAIGNPCKVLRKITEADRLKY